MNPDKRAWKEAERRMWGCPVGSLQLMLSRLSERYSFLPKPAADGIFGGQTLEAVMLFQKYLFPPVTGVVDQRTWTAIRDAWEDMEREECAPRLLRAFPRDFRAEVGDQGERLYLVQAMFQSLSGVLDGIAEERIDGIHSGNSVENVMWLQRAAGLPATGVLDSRTWDALARLYELFLVREAESLPGRG